MASVGNIDFFTSQFFVLPCFIREPDFFLYGSDQISLPCCTLRLSPCDFVEDVTPLSDLYPKKFLYRYLMESVTITGDDWLIK